MVSKSTIWRRRKRAEALGCSVEELPDGRGRHGHHATGARNGSWADGITKSSHGYLKVNVGVGHMLADPNGFAYLHLLVWIAAGNRAPEAGEVLHHISGSRTDNRIENLKLMSNGDHVSYHNTGKHRDNTHVVHDSETGRFSSRALSRSAAIDRGQSTARMAGCEGRPIAPPST